MKKSLALLAASAAFAVVASVASAAPANDVQSCTDGYRVLPKHQIISCGTTAQFAPAAVHSSAPTRVASSGASQSMMAKGVSDCRPGHYWLMPGANADVLMPCR